MGVECFGNGEFWATIVGVRAGVGEGVGVAFWFFLFPFVGLLGEEAAAEAGVASRPRLSAFRVALLARPESIRSRLAVLESGAMPGD